MEQTRNEDDARREKTRDMKHRRREGSKNKDMISCRKIDHRNF